MQKKVNGLRTTTAVALLGIAAAALAQNAPVDTIHTRQKSLKALGESLKVVRDQSRASSPDFAAIKVAAEDIKKTSASITTWFPQGTGTEAGVKTAALPTIWQDSAGFQTAGKNFAAAAAKFADIAASGDKAAIQAGVGPLGNACRGCHQKFRLRED